MAAIKLVSWNICDTTGERRRPPLSERGPRLARFLRHHHADASVLLFVEASSTSLDHLRPHLPEYEWVQVQAADHPDALTMLLAYRDLALTHTEKIWLSPERDRPWHRRFALRARFVHRRSEKRFEMWGVHMPLRTKIRPVTLATLLEEVDVLPPTDPVVLLGDFNTIKGKRSRDELDSIRDHDLFEVRPRKFLGREWEPTGTYFGYSYDRIKFDPAHGSMLDRAFVRCHGSTTRLQTRADLDTCTSDAYDRDAYVSDHHALVVQLSL